MSDQKPERASLGVADTTGMASASVDLMPKTSAFPDAVDLAVPAIATVAPPMIAPDHEAPAADRPGIDPKAAIVEAVTAPEPQAEANKSEIKTEMTADTEIGTISVKPVKPEQVKVEALTAEPEKIEPAKIQAAKPERAKPEPARLDLVKSDKGKSDKVKPELTKAQAAGGNLAATGKVEAAASSSAAKSPSTILDLIRTEPVKSEPIKTAAAGELLKVETPKLSMLAANAPKVGPMAAAAPKPETAIKPDAPIKSVAATKTEAVVRPEPAAKPETVARPETVAKSEPVAKPASAAKPEVSATRAVTPVRADAGPATKAGAFAAVDKAAAWAKAKFKTEPFKFDATSKSASAAATAAGATGAGAALPPPQRGQAPPPHAVNGRLGLPAMAAILLLSMIVGGVAGGLVTAKFVTRSGGGDVADAAAGEAADSTLGATVARIDNDVAALRASLDQTNQTSLVELNKSAERLDRLEKILGDLSTKSSAKPSELQRLSEAVDRLRAAQASATAQAPARDSAASVPQAVGAINAAAPPAGVASRQEASRAEAARTEASRAEPARAETAHPEPSRTEATKPKVVEGWVLRDVGRGGALIEGRGGLYEVYAGDPVPGLGKVDAIRKQDGRWVVVTTKGLVVAR
ncbi:MULTISPECIES: hypothetical protein [unclassified Bradyrhizobium]|uniref:hypothetical protein n=1 Tax=unclassified Bradyrhizobium TaxID=2631580 RepID=UPI0028E43E8B|nr:MULTISPECIES: hypothetical protein [unclassified Bradyrhizobium]